MKTATIQLPNKALHLSVPNEITEWRVDTFWGKEPETLAWINTFEPDDLFVDIGANIGLYSLYAALTRHVNVLAFEPESLNYALLNRNIHLNGLDKQVKAYALALSHETAFDTIHLSSFDAGQSCHHFKESPKNPAFHQGCFSLSVDTLIAKGFIPVPEHIKIDVDGCEHLILEGAKTTLKNPKLKSVLVELNPHLKAHASIIKLMEKHGFTSNSSPKDLGNCLFYRACSHCKE